MDLTEEALNEMYDVLHSIAHSLSKVSDMTEKEYELMSSICSNTPEVINARNKSATRNNYSFFQNTDCEYYPCHKVADSENFNCLFCYCPLYHKADCPGIPEKLPNGIKDCTNCTLPHYDYQAIIGALRKEMM